MVFDPLAAFPQFYGNPQIQRLSNYPRWTISGDIGAVPASSQADGSDQDQQLKQRKAPIDIQHLLAGCNAGCRHESPIRGAYRIDETCLVDLPTLTREVPASANCAFHLRSEHDGLMVVDIEKTCPPAIAAQLLRIPGALYSELSMSGKGYHLLVPLPANLDDFPLAAVKTKLQEKHGWYEVLFEHWITFTRQPIPAWRTGELELQPCAIEDGESIADHSFDSFEQLYASLAQHATVSAASAAPVSLSHFIDEDEHEVDARIPFAEHIIAQTLAHGRDSLKTLGDFHDDHSRWEFSVLARLRLVMSDVMTDLVIIEGQTYTDSQFAWLLYRAAREVIPPRAKHAQLRSGQPFLLHRAAVLIGQDQDGY